MTSEPWRAAVDGVCNLYHWPRPLWTFEGKNSEWYSFRSLSQKLFETYVIFPICVFSMYKISKSLLCMGFKNFASKFFYCILKAEGDTGVHTGRAAL